MNYTEQQRTSLTRLNYPPGPRLEIIPMPPSLNIQAGSMTDRGLKAYRDFISVYTLEGTRPGLDLLDIPQEREEAFLKMRPDIKPEEWELGRTAFQNQQKYGSTTWYDWSIKNWGTKWNAYDCIPGKDALTFSTAWAAHLPRWSDHRRILPGLRQAVKRVRR